MNCESKEMVNRKSESELNMRNKNFIMSCECLVSKFCLSVE